LFLIPVVVFAVLIMVKPRWWIRIWETQAMVPRFMKRWPMSVPVTRFTGVLMLAFVAFVVVLALVLPAK